MAKLDYLTTKTAPAYIAERFNEVMTVGAIRKHIERGNIKTKRYSRYGIHLITRKEIERWWKGRERFR